MGYGEGHPATLASWCTDWCAILSIAMVSIAIVSYLRPWV